MPNKETNVNDIIRKYTQSSMTVEQIDKLSDTAYNMPIPKFPIPYVGPCIDILCFAAKVGCLIWCFTMRNKRIELEITVMKQLESQENDTNDDASAAS